MSRESASLGVWVIRIERMKIQEIITEGGSFSTRNITTSRKTSAIGDAN